MSSDWLANSLQINVICLIRHPAAFVNSLMRVNWHFDFDNFLESPGSIEEHLYQYRDQLESPPSDFVEEGALLWLCLNPVLTTYLQNLRIGRCGELRIFPHLRSLLSGKYSKL